MYLSASYRHKRFWLNSFLLVCHSTRSWVWKEEKKKKNGPKKIYSLYPYNVLLEKTNHGWAGLPHQSPMVRPQPIWRAAAQSPSLWPDMAVLLGQCFSWRSSRPPAQPHSHHDLGTKLTCEQPWYNHHAPQGLLASPPPYEHDLGVHWAFVSRCSWHIKHKSDTRRAKMAWIIYFRVSTCSLEEGLFFFSFLIIFIFYRPGDLRNKPLQKECKFYMWRKGGLHDITVDCLDLLISVDSLYLGLRWNLLVPASS